MSELNEQGLDSCPFCGSYPELPSGEGTQYEIECDCGRAMSCVQISDYMTTEEKISDGFQNGRYQQIYIDRAMKMAIGYWNERISL